MQKGATTDADYNNLRVYSQKPQTHHMLIILSALDNEVLTIPCLS